MEKRRQKISIFCHPSVKKKTSAGRKKSARPGMLKAKNPLGFFNIHSVAKYQKKLEDHLETLKIFRKKSHNAERKSKGDRKVLYVTLKKKEQLI